MNADTLTGSMVHTRSTVIQSYSSLFGTCADSEWRLHWRKEGTFSDAAHTTVCSFASVFYEECPRESRNLMSALSALDMEEAGCCDWIWSRDPHNQRDMVCLILDRVCNAAVRPALVSCHPRDGCRRPRLASAVEQQTRVYVLPYWLRECRWQRQNTRRGPWAPGDASVSHARIGR